MSLNLQPGATSKKIKANWNLSNEVLGRRILSTPQDFAAVLATAFLPDMMFETSVNPEAVVRHLAEEIAARKASDTTVWGPEFVDGNLHLRLRNHLSGLNCEITVRPEGDSEIIESSVSPA